MGLVDYGSDSDTSTRSPSPPPTASSSSSSVPPAPRGLQLPPPKATSLNLPPPKGTTTAAPKKAKGGPVRILLDDLAPPTPTSPADPDEPAKKRPKLSLGNAGAALPGGDKPLTGLAAMLPKPKNASSRQAPPPPPAPSATSTAGVGGLFGTTAGPGDKSTAPGPMFLPPSVAAARAKGKAPAPPKPAEPAVDFFGIGSVTAAPPPPSSPSSKPSLSSAPSISAAPSISSAPPPSSSAAAQPAFGHPTPSDPYPGFTQLPSGEWVAKDQRTYDMWVAWSAQQAASGSTSGGKDKSSSREFDDKAIEEQGGLVEVDEAAQRARDAWNNRPSQVPGKDGKEQYKTSADIKGIPSQIGGMARRKHQLSSLLAAAHDNRAELEERIAQARANRKGAGSKYGF